MESKKTTPARTSSTDFVNEIIHNEDFKLFFQSLVTETVSRQMNELSTAVCKLLDEVTSLTTELDQVKGELHEINYKQDHQVNFNNRTEQLVNGLTNKLDARSLVIEDLQQYTRRNCVVVTGVPEVGGENTDDIIVQLSNDKMKVPLTETDLDRTHRIGNRTGDKPRPIVVKFSRYNTRYKFIKSRKNLKGTKIGVQELLTPYTQHLLKRAKELVASSRHIKSVWTWDGKVSVQIEQNGQKRTLRVKHEQDLYKIYDQTAGYTERD